MFWISAVTMVGAVTTATLGWIRWRRHRSEVSLSEVRAALKTCGWLCELLGHLQQHRGMCSAWLGGDKSFQARIAAKRGEISSVFAALVNAAAAESDRPYPCFTSNDLSLFRFKWQSLTDKLHEMSVEQSIAQHSHMIATVLDWLATYGEARIDLPFGYMLPVGATRNFSHRLPALTECLGQARAIGASVAARGKCAPVARVRMMFLITRAESLLQQSVAATGMDSAGAKARRTVEELTGIIRKHMLVNSDVAISTDSYFATATQAIDAVFAWMLESSASLDSELMNPSGLARPGTPTLLTRRA